MLLHPNFPVKFSSNYRANLMKAGESHVRDLSTYELCDAIYSPTGCKNCTVLKYNSRRVHGFHTFFCGILAMHYDIPCFLLARFHCKSNNYKPYARRIPGTTNKRTGCARTFKTKTQKEAENSPGRGKAGQEMETTCQKAAAPQT